MSKNFYSCTDTPKVTPSPVGEKVYEWEYLDPTGEIKKEDKNLYEEIQSYKNQVDYKLRIKKGEEINNGNGIYLDTTKFSGDYGDIDKYLTGLRNDIQSQIDEIKRNTTNSGAVKSETSSETAKNIEESRSVTSGVLSTSTSGNGDSFGSPQSKSDVQGVGK